VIDLIELLDGVTNMRLDNELLSKAEGGHVECRIYGWDGVWISVGRFESPERDLVDPSRVRWVRRPTGGKAVLHGHDVTVSYAIPLDGLGISERRSIRTVYRAGVGPLVGALRFCGVDAVLGADSAFGGRGQKSGDCFAFSSPNDILDATTGLKICGCALRMTETAMLLQASIPYGPPLVDPASVIVNAESRTVMMWNASSFETAVRAALGVS